jgi:hypothetical protein
VKILKIVAINFVTFAVLLIVVNWACSFYLQSAGQGSRDKLPNYASDHAHAVEVFADYNRVQHQYEPFVGWKTLPYKGTTLHITTSGQRTHEPPTYSGKKEKIVRFFGGSTMWGEGSDDQHTIPALFNVQNPQYEIYNHAQLAYNSRQELDALISLYSKNEKTDLVIFYDGVNDAAFLCPKDIKQLPAHRLVPMFREKLYVGKSALIKDMAKKLFVENILKTIYAFTYKTTPETSPYDCLSTPGKAEEIAEIMIRNWEIAHELVTNRQGKFIAILQPAAFISKPKTDHLKLDEELGKNFQEVYKHLKQKIATRNYDWVVDLSDQFDGDDYIFIDFCHVSPNGNAIMAKAITNVVKQTKEPIIVSLLKK